MRRNMQVTRFVLPFLFIILSTIVKVETQRFTRRTRFQGFRQPDVECSIFLRGVRGVNRRQSRIVANITCDGVTLLDREFRLNSLQQQTVREGLTLFSEIPSGGMAYVALESTRIRVVQCELVQLPDLPREELAAPMAFFDVIGDVDNCTIRDNDADFRSGAVIVDGRSSIDFFNATIRDNRGRHGSVLIRSTSITDFDFCTFERNRGIDVGVARVVGVALVRFVECLFVRNFGQRFANEISVTSRGQVILYGSSIYGDSTNAAFLQYLRDPNRPESELESFNLPIAGVASITGKASLHVLDCLVSGHIGQRGAIYASGATNVFTSRSEFENNTAMFGAGLYVNAERGGVATIDDTKFTSNVARFGGALVIAGNGSYTIDLCTFRNNTALYGGAIWGDYTSLSLGGQPTCPRANAGSRVSILTSNFVQNRAEMDGGALSLTCTDILAANSSFDENQASNGNGGSIHATRTNDVQLIQCQFLQNKAGGGGGALHVNNSNQIIAQRCTFEGNNATGGNGGTILSISGSAIRVEDSTVESSSSLVNGGAFYAERVRLVDFRNSAFSACLASQSGGVLFGNNIRQFLWRNVSVSFNAANSSGAVHVRSASQFQLNDVQFKNNNSTVQNTGALGLENVRIIRIRNSVFESNIATASCGSLTVVNSEETQISFSNFLMNSASRSGGGICVQESAQVTIESVLLQQNEASSGNGGALFGSNVEKMELRNATLTNNRAGMGGAISGVRIRDFQMMESGLMDNFAVYSGGAVHLRASSVSLETTEFFRNNAGASRGPSLPSSLTQAVERRYSGGAIYIIDGIEFVASKTQFVQNEAALTGGSISLTRIDRLEFKTVFFANSTADLAGGCFLGHSLRRVRFTDALFSACEARNGGGAVFSGKTVISGENNRFQLNSADRGGAFLCYGQARVNFAYSLFLHNSAQEGSSLAADCNCQVDVRYSELHRDDDLPNNGDFFKTEDECGRVRSLSNAFYGAIDNEDSLWYVWLIIAVAGVSIFVGAVVICCCRRRRGEKGMGHRPANEEGIASTAKDAELSSEGESYTTEEDEESPTTSVGTDSDGSLSES